MSNDESSVKQNTDSILEELSIIEVEIIRLNNKKAALNRELELIRRMNEN